MPRLPWTLYATAAMALCALSALSACSPALNWRDVRPDNTGLSLLLPCKPDKVQKTVPLGGQPTELRLLGCDADGATFAVAVADLGDASKAAAVLLHWQNLTLANMRAPLPGERPAPASPDAPATLATEVMPFKLPGVNAASPAVLVKASGRRADGSSVMGHAAYFSQGTQVFQVVLYADKLKPEVSDAFFSSLKLE